MLEPFEEKLGELLETARPAPELSQGWQARAAVRMAAVAGKADRKETVGMRRLAYAMVFLLVIGLVGAGVFTRSRPPDGKTLLISAAQAMEAAESVHCVCHGVKGDPASPSGMVMMNEPTEIWVSKRVVASRTTGGDGSLLMALGINLNTDEAWDYSAESGVRRSGDLAPMASQAARFMDKLGDAFLSGALPTLPTFAKMPLTDVQESVTTEEREGSEINVVTLRGVRTTSPRLIRERHVFQVEKGTNRLIGAQRYVRAEGSEEQLVQTVEQFTYNVPVPADLAPENAVRKPATVNIQESDKFLSLVMSEDGKEVWRTDAPR